MPQFGFNENGDIELYAEYTTKGVNTMRDVFPRGKKTSRLLKMKNKKRMRDVYEMEDKSAVIRRIFYDFLILVLNELCKGGMLVFPGKTNANIALKTLPDEMVKKFSLNGGFTKIDIAKARYKVPVFKFDFGPRSPRKDRIIKVPDRILEKAYKNAEEGLIKYVNFRKMINHDL